jgi:DNA-binding response OmpR family regulator
VLVGADDWAAEPRAMPAPARQPEADMGTGPRVLVVDDDRAIRDLVGALLEDEGYAVRCVGDGTAALGATEGETFDLVVADVRLPGLDGAELARRLVARGVPVVLMSAAYAAVEVPGAAFVPKPFDLDRLLREVRRAVRPRPG